jgi:hypothetical protein
MLYPSDSPRMAFPPGSPFPHRRQFLSPLQTKMVPSGTIFVCNSEFRCLTSELRIDGESPDHGSSHDCACRHRPQSLCAPKCPLGFQTGSPLCAALTAAMLWALFLLCTLLPLFCYLLLSIVSSGKTCQLQFLKLTWYVHIDGASLVA